MPAGTLHPNDMITSRVRSIVAMASEKIMNQRLSLLDESCQQRQTNQDEGDSLAKFVVVMATLTFPEEDLHALSHVDPEKLIRIADDCRQNGEEDRFRDLIITKVLLSEHLYSQVPLHDKRTVQATESSNDEIE